MFKPSGISLCQRLLTEIERNTAQERFDALESRSAARRLAHGSYSQHCMIIVVRVPLRLA